MPSFEELLLKLEERFILKEISEETYLELKAKYEKLIKEGQIAAGGGVQTGDVGMIKNSIIKSETHIDSHDAIGAPAVGGNQVINIGSEVKHVTKTGEHCRICGILLKDEYFKCSKCNSDYLCMKHFDEEYEVCKNCAQDLRKKENKRQLEEHGIPKEYKCPITGMEFLYVKDGEYQMGDMFGDGGGDEKPVHMVKLDDFYIGKYPVTFIEYDQFCEETERNEPEDEGRGRGRRPVINVSWDDAVEFCEWLSEKTGKEYRLPTEAEWEYAARSRGKKEKWAGTNKKAEIGKYAWHDKNSNDKTHPVGLKKSNGLGLYDMSGNVWEWVNDWYDGDYYKISQRDNPEGPNSEDERVLRGGSGFNDQWLMRTSFRSGGDPNEWYHDTGFRCAASP